MTDIKEHINYKKLIFLLDKLNLEFPVAELSRTTGYSDATISPYINGKVKPSTKFLQSIADHYKVDLAEFKEETEKSNVSEIRQNEDDEEVFTNKNGIRFLIYPDDSIKIEVPVLPFKAYASSQIECYFDENFRNKEFTKIRFTVDKVGKGNYLAFISENESMNGGGILDTPGGAELLGREIGKHLWLNLHKNDYGFVLMTTNAVYHKDIINYDDENGMFTLHSRNPKEKDFQISINDVYKIFNVIKRTF